MDSMPEVRVRVRWFPVVAGGRLVPFTGTRWPALSRFQEQGDHWPDGSWTVAVEFEPPLVGEIAPTLGTARFLVPEAPHHWLRPGQNFGLYYGLERVADVEVLS
jgi:hypothetical protein